MAAFKVGQKVRIVRDIPGPFRTVPQDFYAGREAVILRAAPFKPWDWEISIAGLAGDYCAYSAELAPLTDPDAEWATGAIQKLLRDVKEPLPLDSLAFGE